MGLPVGPLGASQSACTMTCIGSRQHGLTGSPVALRGANEQTRMRLFKLFRVFDSCPLAGHWSNGPDSLCGRYVVSVLQVDKNERLAARGSSGVSGLGDAIPRPTTYN